MKQPLEDLIGALREELQQYGELLTLFEQQQESLIQRNADQVLSSVSAIQEQSAKVQSYRRKRVEAHQDLADSLSLPPDGLLATLLPALPPSRRPQVEALMDENNRLLRRIQQRARQNHVLLTQSIEHMSKVMQSLMGVGKGMLYDGGGSVAPTNQGRPIYEAVG